MRKIIYLKLCCIAILFLPIHMMGQEYMPLTVSSGFNEDVIAEDSPASTHTTAAVDSSESAANNAFMSVDYPGATVGLPANGLITTIATATPGLTFQLASYEENNVLKINENGGTGTLVFEEAQSALQVFILATSGSASSTFTGVITFTDETTQSFSTQTIPDWFQTGVNPAAIQGIGRVSRNNENPENNTSNPKLFQATITIDGTNQDKLIQEIEFTKTSSNTGFLNIFAVSAEIVPDCPRPVNLSVENTTYESADLYWESLGDSFDVKWGETGFSVETEGALEEGFESGETLSGLEADTSYDFYVQRDCGEEDGVSQWAGPFTFFTGYCEAGSNSSSYRINGFSTDGGWTNISNMDNGTSNGYNNYSSMSISQSAGGEFDYSVSVPSYTIVEIWIDLDNDFVFEEDELVAEHSHVSNPTTFTGTINIPADIEEGDYRIRVRSRYYYNTQANPCGNVTYGETEDYTLAIVPVPSCLPPTDLGVSNSTFTSADLNWESDGDTFDVIWGEEDFDMETEGSLEEDFENGGTLSGLETDTYYDFYVRQDCGEEDGESLWAGPYTFYTGYCQADSNSSSYRINGFSTDGGWTNISNMDNGTVNGYNNYSSLSVSQSAGGEFYYSVNIPGFTIVEIWVDFDNDLVFDEDELVAEHSYTFSTTTFTGTIDIPADTEEGDYRIRVRSRYYSNTQANPCGNMSYGETEDYTLVIVPIPTCLPPTDLEVNNATYTSADLSWESDGDTFDIIWGEEGFDIETEGTLEEDFENGGTLSGLDPETFYDFYVRQDCGEEDGESMWAGPFTFYTGYCQADSGSSSYRINGFSTEGGWTNISNMDNGTSNGYNNYSSMSISQSAGGEFDYSVSVPAYTIVEIWIDLDNDFVLDEDELVAEHSHVSNPTTFTGTINIPADIEEGDYRIRVRSRYYYNTQANPCGNMSYGETEDYTLTIIPVPTCLPPTSLAADNVTLTSVDLSWESDGDTFDIIWGEAGFDIETEGTLEENFENGGTLSGLIVGLTYEFYVRQDCGEEDGESLWAGPLDFTFEYCTPSYIHSDNSHRIMSVTIEETDFEDNISSYTDRDRTGVEIPPMDAGEEYTMTVTVNGWTSMGIAIDFNQNGVFDTDERVALPEYVASDPVTYTVTIEIPDDVSNGIYRMRVWQREANSQAGEDPCGDYDYGTWADYNISIGDLCPTPEEVIVSDITKVSADISWTAPEEAPEEGYRYEVRTTGNPGEDEGMVADGTTTVDVLTINIEDLDPDTTYYVYVQSVCSEEESSDWVTEEFTTLCDYPEIVSVTAGEVCGAGSATISADFGDDDIIVRWYATEDATEHLFEGNSFTTPQVNTETIFYAEGRTEDGCVSPRVPVEVTITESSELELSSTELELCFGSTSTPITVEEGLEDYDTYVWEPSTGVTGDAETGWTFSPEETTTYTLTASQSEGVCAQLIEVEVVVNPLPEVEELEEEYLICPETVQAISTGLPTTGEDGYDVVWSPFDNLYLDEAGTTAYDGESVSTVYFLSEEAGDTTYEVTVTSSKGCESTFETTVNVPEVITPDITELYLCVPTAVDQALESDLNLVWFDSLDSDEAIGEFTESGTYYVLNEVGSCQSDRVAVEVTVVGVTTPTTGAVEQQFCDSATIEDITVNHTEGSTLNVYETATGGTALSEGTPIFTGTFYVSEQIGECESDRVAVSVTLTQTPDAIFPQTITICGFEVLSNVEVGQLPNTELIWYENETTPQPIANTDVQVYDGTYYVSQRIGVCESERTAITFVVNEVLPQPVASSQTFCGSAVVSDLVVTGEDGAMFWWFDSATSDEPLASDAVLSNGTYYVSQSLNECESARKAISVQIVNTAAPQIDNMSLCEGTTIGEVDIPATTGVTYKWYVSPTAITALPASTTLINGETYYISSNYNGCESERVIVDIETTPVPNAPTGEPVQAFVYNVSINEVTVSDLVVNEDNVLWFAHEDLTNPLDPETPLSDGATYYAVIVSDAGCVSEPFAVTVTVTLGNEKFDRAQLVYYPNPTQGILNIRYTDTIEKVEIYNTIGQLVATQEFSSNQIAVDMHQLSNGTYLLKLHIDGYQQLIKVVKN